ncbi:MAG: radical SAM protein [Actinobacteria bacterium]|nr:radical SAM protein [Actinomycetota bacterium]
MVKQEQKEKKNYKIILCNPPYYRFINIPFVYQNLGLGYLAGNLMSNGYTDVKIYQFDAPVTLAGTAKNFETFEEYDPFWGENYYREMNDLNNPLWLDIKEVLKREKPDVLGITSMTPQAESARILARIARDINPEITVIQGGIHASLLPDEVLTKSPIDIVALTEFDLHIAPLIDYIRRGLPLEEIPNIAFKNRRGEIKKTEKAAPLQVLDGASFPVREIHTVGENKPTIPALMPMITSRGCPYNCSFCARLSLWGHRVRYRSAENVVEEIEMLYKKYRARNFIFEDDTFTLNKPRLIRIFELLREKRLDVSWECQTKVNVVNEELIKLLKDNGCTRISIGAESGNQKILDSINKKQTIQQIKNASRIIREAGINLSPFFMIGYPNENAQTIEDTFNLIKEIDCYTAHVYPLIPMPGSRMYEDLKAKGTINEDRWFFYPFWNVNIFKRDHLTSKEVYDKFVEIRKYVDTKRRNAIKKYSRNPRYIFRRIYENLYSPKQLLYLAKRFFKIQFSKF